MKVSLSDDEVIVPEEELLPLLPPPVVGEFPELEDVPDVELVPLESVLAEEDSMLEIELSHAERVKIVIIVRIIVFFIFHLVSFYEL